MQIKKSMALLLSLAMLVTPIGVNAQEIAETGKETVEVSETNIIEETVIEEETPSEEETPAEEETPSEEETPAEEETPSEEETPAEEETSVIKEIIETELTDFEITEDDIVLEEDEVAAAAEDDDIFDRISVDGAVLLNLEKDREKYAGIGNGEVIARDSDLPRLEAPGYVRWTNTNMADFGYGSVANAIGYDIILFKLNDGGNVNDIDDYKPIVRVTIPTSMATGQYSFWSWLTESGSYRVAVGGIADDVNYSDSKYRVSTVFDYKRPAAQLSVPDDLSWRGKKAEWKPVNGAAGYNVVLYEDGEWAVRVNVKDTSYDWSDEMADGNTYTFTVSALSGNINQTAHSLAAGPSDPWVKPDENKTREFVERMYKVALNRDADEDGLNYWTQKLVNGDIDGASFSWGVIMGAEFANRKLNDSDFLDVLYRAFFDRAADADGKSNWKNKLENGISREYVMAGFVNSAEFANLCKTYGIMRGECKLTNWRDQNEGVTMFVNRIYTKALGRAGEPGGLDDWTGRILRKEMSPEDVAKSFFFSAEFANKKLDNTEFVKVLYRTFMGREYDESGLADWVGKLDAGTSREKVLEGFSRSAEFSNIMKEYGL